MAAPVMGNHSEALVEEEQQLRIPIIGRQRPAVAKHNGLTFAPVFVVNLRAVFGRNRAHSLENGTTIAEAISLAKKLNDMNALALALFHAGFAGHFDRDPAEVERCASNMIELSTRHNLPFGGLEERFFAVGRKAFPPVTQQASRGSRRESVGSEWIWCEPDKIKEWF